MSHRELDDLSRLNIGSATISSEPSTELETQTPPSVTKSSSVGPDAEDISDGPPPKRRRVFRCVKPSEPVLAASQFPDPDNECVADVTPEPEALQELVHAYLQAHEDDEQASNWIMVELSDFTIYNPYKPTVKGGVEPRSYEMEALHFLNCKVSISQLLVDGTLSCAGVSLRIEGVPFNRLAIDGYGDISKPDVMDGVSIQSRAAFSSDARVWYNLRRPSKRYRRFHDAFLWVANLAKHFVDYISEHSGVSLRDFRSKFRQWMVCRYGNSATVKEWLDQAHTADLRQAVVANYRFLWNEHWSLHGQRIQHLPIWQEIYAADLTAIPQQPLDETRTVVTPYVYDCFRTLYFQDQLKPLILNEAVDKLRESRMTSLGFVPVPSPPPLSVDTLLEDALNTGGTTTDIVAGDVIALARDETTVWKDTSALWLAYVQGVKVRGSRMRPFLDVIWLYRPDDTTLAGAAYPVPNELFFSDNCNCGDGRIPAEDVVCKLPVDWWPKVIPAERCFVRQKYMTDEHAFVTLTAADFRCHHHSREHPQNDWDACLERYTVGDTVYVHAVPSPTISAELGGTDPSGCRESANHLSNVLEPAAIVAFNESTSNVTVRRMERRQRSEPSSEPNELLWTDDLLHVPAGQIVERCYVRVFDEIAPIPVPYNRKGNGHYWFIRMRLTLEGLKPLDPRSEEIQASFTQGPLLSDAPKHQLLRGLDLFCGGGNFGRGLEEGGAVRMRWAVEMAIHALHTYRANLWEGDKVQLFLGSINDFFSKVLSGEGSELLPNVGEVDFICGGSSCRGFSAAHAQRLSDTSRRNASLVGSLAAAVDLYRPKYAIFENVTSMSNNRKVLAGQNVFSQLLGCLVGMGYQVTQFNLDAWSFGAAQSRGRLFISIAAPGMPPIEHPQLSHAHPPDIKNKSLGWAANRESFGDRKFGPTPFPMVSARDATSDLPDIQDGRVGTCVAYPDHRMPTMYNTVTRVMMSMIPKTPEGSGFKKAAALGLLPPPQMELARYWNSKGRKSESSSAWSRISGSKVFPTVMRALRPADAYGGYAIHWSQDRTMTLMEARRAQGYPDDEVLIGRILEQWGIVGDAVCRQVALALGVRLREACMKAELAEDSEPHSFKGGESPAHPQQCVVVQQAWSSCSFREAGDSST